MLKRNLVAGVLLLFSLLSWSADEPDHGIHEELRAVLQQIESAINFSDFDKMLPVLSEQVRATPINQESLSSRAEVSAYFQKWFGSGGYLKKLEMKLVPDALTELSEDKSWGIVRGKGIERYVLADGRPYELITRWTATMVKESDGLWRIRAIHIGTDFLNNSILTEAEQALGKALGGGAFGGLMLGFLLGWLVFRKKKA